MRYAALACAAYILLAAGNQLPARGGRPPTATFRLAVGAAAAYAAAALVVAVALPRHPAYVAIHAAAALASLVAVGCAAWTGWRSRGHERTSRFIIAAALIGSVESQVDLLRAAVAGQVVPDVSIYYAATADQPGVAVR